MWRVFIYLGLITLSLFGKSVYGIECYRCASELGGSCESPSQTDGVVIVIDRCEGGSCMKYKTYNGYYRECSYIHYAEGCREGKHGDDDAEVCACNEDYCNKSVAMRPSVLAYITPALLLFIYKYFR